MDKETKQAQYERAWRKRHRPTRKFKTDTRKYWTSQKARRDYDNQVRRWVQGA